MKVYPTELTWGKSLFFKRQHFSMIHLQQICETNSISNEYTSRPERELHAKQYRPTTAEPVCRHSQCEGSILP